MQLRLDGDFTQEDMRTVIANPGFFNCFGDRELRHVPPSVACIAHTAEVADPYAGLTGNQVCT